jgi:hypothetical protein
MNASFSFQRLTWLVQKHWSENGRKYLMSLLVIAGIFVAWFSLQLLGNRDWRMSEDVQFGAYFFGLYAVGTFYASIIFSDLNNKSNGTNYLSLPASHLEKTIVAWLFCFVFFYISYTLVFYAVDVLFVKIANQLLLRNAKENLNIGATSIQDSMSTITNVFVKRWNMDVNMMRYFHLGFIALQAIFFLGSVYFTKYNFIKTAVACIALMFLIFLYFYFIDTAMHRDNNLTFHRGLIELQQWDNDSKQRVYALPSSVSNVLVFLFQYAWAPVLWFISYKRLQEKEI